MNTIKQDLKRFIKTVSDKDYKQANENLHKVVEAKIKSRIVAALEQKNN
jgi:hypothetical protein